MQLDQRLGQRQAEARALVALAQRVLDLAEGRERHRDVLERHADTVVGDLEHEPGVRARPGRDLDRAAGRGELDRVGEQVVQDLAQLAPVGTQLRQVVRDLGLQRDAARLRRSGRLGDAGADQLGQRDRGLLEGDLAELEPGDVHEVVDQVEQVVPGLVDVVQVLPVAGAADRTEDLVLDDLREADDGVERRAQLVAHLGEELRAAALGQLGVGLGRGERGGLVADPRRQGPPAAVLRDLAPLDRDQERGRAPDRQERDDPVDRRDLRDRLLEAEREAGEHQQAGEGGERDHLSRFARPPAEQHHGQVDHAAGHPGRD